MIFKFLLLAISTIFLSEVLSLPDYQRYYDSPEYNDRRYHQNNYFNDIDQIKYYNEEGYHKRRPYEIDEMKYYSQEDHHKRHPLDIFNHFHGLSDIHDLKEEVVERGLGRIRKISDRIRDAVGRH